MRKTEWSLSGRLVVAHESLKTKEKSVWVILKVVEVNYGSGRLLELLITKFKSQFKRGFTHAHAHATRASTVQRYT